MGGRARGKEAGAGARTRGQGRWASLCSAGTRTERACRESPGRESRRRTGGASQRPGGAVSLNSRRGSPRSSLGPGNLPDSLLFPNWLVGDYGWERTPASMKGVMKHGFLQLATLTSQPQPLHPLNSHPGFHPKFTHWKCYQSCFPLMYHIDPTDKLKYI